jgi:hypothetical protein
MSNTNGSILPRGDAGAMLWLAENVEACRNGGVIYARVSGGKQAGEDGENLEAQAMSVRSAMKELDPGLRVRGWFLAIEGGKVSPEEEARLKERRRRLCPKLKEAAAYAKDLGVPLVVADLSRFIRAEAYDRQANSNALPTPDEWRRLGELTLGVPLLSVADPLFPRASGLAWRPGGRARPAGPGRLMPSRLRGG